MNNKNGFTIIELIIVILIISILVYLLIPVLTVYKSFFISKDPYPPRTYYKDVNEITYKDIKLYHYKKLKLPVFTDKTKITVLNFKDLNNTNVGIFVSDIFSSILQKHNNKVVDRSYIKKISKELKINETDSLSEFELIDKIGKVTTADFFIIGTITSYNYEAQKLFLPLKIREEDKKDYTNEYNECRDSYVNSWFVFWQSKKKSMKILRNTFEILSLEELEHDLRSHTKEEIRNIVSLGISAKIIDVRNSKVRWIGQAETIDLTLLNAATRILNEFYKSIQENK